MTERTAEDYIERFHSLSPSKRKLLEQRLKGLDVEAVPSPPGGPGLASPIIAVPRDGELPLSFSQQREWFLDQLEPGNPAYNTPAYVRLPWAIDWGALGACFNEIVRRHESLRTTFPAVDGQPVQVIAPRLTPELPLVDLRGLAAERRETEASRLAAAEARRPFDLARGPLLRVTLLRLAPDDHVVLQTLHHIVSDGWSMTVLNGEISQLYRACLAGEPAVLPKLTVQYADYAAAQHQWLQGEALERLTSYWQERLDPPPPLLPLPLDRPRATLAAARSEILPLLIPEAIQTSLRSLAAAWGASLFMLLVAVFKVLLRRYTGEDDVCIGTFIAGRNRPEIEPLIGFFVNTLVLRTDLGREAGDPSSDGPTFRELLDRVREVTRGAYAHQDLPFEMLLEILQVERSTRHTPLFQVMVALENIPQARDDESPDGEPPGPGPSSFAPYQSRAHFDLVLWQLEHQGRLIGHLEYNGLVFDATTIQRLGRHLLTLLAATVASPRERISRLALMSPAELHQLVAEWSATRCRVCPPPSYRELFEAQAERTPEAVAVIDLGTGEELNYRQLNRRANRLADHLRERGVGPEARVGVLLERSCDLVVALVGILKTGGAYVPLDPSYPRERLALILGEASVLVTHRGLAADRLPASALQVVALDADGERIAAASPENPAIRVPAQAAAYVIYTSGSTGRPKGVVVTHQALAWYAAAAIEHYALRAEDRVLQFSSLSFDASVEEIFPCLARGAALVLRSDDMLASIAELFRRCRELGITVMSPPTAFWHEMVAAVEAEPESYPPSLRILCVGGERMLAEQVTAWRRAVGRRALLVNTYGPTETTVVATLGEVRENDDRPGGPAIGRPVPNVRVAVLDDRLRAVPIGVAGELCIGGDGVARGYLGRPGATAERFVPSPRTPGERLYRTGDLVRFLPDGNLEFLGRIDQQVKIRGFRVEPGEIEARLVEHPAVREAVVVAGEEQPGAPRLVAYVVTEPEIPELPVAELRQQLALRLPDYMVPAAWVPLNELPRTPSGKIDRRALPAPTAEGAEADRGYAPPSTETEQLLAEIFSQVLNRERVGIYDNFFEIGGHSLLATRLMTRVRNTFEIDLPLRDLFAAPTVARLAVRLEELIIDELEQLSDEEIEQLNQES